MSTLRYAIYTSLCLLACTDAMGASFGNRPPTYTGQAMNQSYLPPTSEATNYGLGSTPETLLDPLPLQESPLNLTVFHVNTLPQPILLLDHNLSFLTQEVGNQAQGQHSNPLV